MRDPARIDRMISKLRELWVMQPDTRLCQLVMNTGPKRGSIYYVEDDDMEKAIDEAFVMHLQFARERDRN